MVMKLLPQPEIVPSAAYQKPLQIESCIQEAAALWWAAATDLISAKGIFSESCASLRHDQSLELRVSI